MTIYTQSKRPHCIIFIHANVDLELFVFVDFTRDFSFYLFVLCFRNVCFWNEWCEHERFEIFTTHM